MTTTTSARSTSSTGRTLGDGWRDAAACGRVDPEVFYPLDLDPVEPAVRAAWWVCAHCAVLPECLGDVLAPEDPTRRWGVIGGTTPNERAALYARQQAAAADPAGVAA